MNLQLQPASQLTVAQLTDLFNAGYAGYIVPVNASQDFIRAHVQQNDIDLDRSLVAYDEDRPVGLALLGVRGVAGWVGAVGVVTAARKHGVGRRLMHALFDGARRAGLTGISLEVIVGNDAAHALYLNVGMRDVGHVLVLERPAAPLAPSAWRGTLQPAAVDDALAGFDALHARPNPWQRQPQSIRQATNPPQARLAVADGVVRAYAVGYFTPERIALLDVAVTPDEPQALTALLSALHAEHPDAAGRLVNLDDRDPAAPVMQALGYSAPLSQHLMHIDL